MFQIPSTKEKAVVMAAVVIVVVAIVVVLNLMDISHIGFNRRKGKKFKEFSKDNLHCKEDYYHDFHTVLNHSECNVR